MRRAALGAAMLVLIGVAPAAARAQSPPAPEAPGPADALASAKELFRKGLALLDAGDAERALDYFLRSRALVASSKNTANAAICLDRLGRYDEALEMYEELLTSFSAELDDDDRAVIGPAMTALRGRVGGVQVSSNVDGTVVIDGRARGRLPTLSPIRVIAGKHVVRILKDGYAPFETSVDVVVRETVPVEARLAPLSGAGVLRVEDPLLVGAEVFVDAVRVGVAPWEGTLGPGRHVVWTRKESRGSAPTAIVVLQGQTALARLSSGALGPPLSIQVEPATAEITLDAVLLGSRSWEGRVPVGHHELVVSEAGYQRRTTAVDVPPMPSSALLVRVRLDVDPTDPRWPRARTGRLFVTGFGAFAVGSTLRSDAEGGCPDRCSSDPAVTGFIAGLRGGYRFEGGLGLELDGGYLSLGSSFSRTERSTYPDSAGGSHPVSYQLEDDLSLRGPFGGGGISYERTIASRFSLISRMTVGLLFAESSDPVAGTAATSGDAVPLRVSDRNQSASSASVLLEPQLGANVIWGGFHVGISLGVAFFPSGGPRLSHAQAGIVPDCPATADPATVGCVPNSSVVAGERVQGPFWVWVPQLEAGYEF